MAGSWAASNVAGRSPPARRKPDSMSLLGGFYAQFLPCLSTLIIMSILFSIARQSYAAAYQFAYDFALDIRDAFRRRFAIEDRGVFRPWQRSPAMKVCVFHFPKGAYRGVADIDATTSGSGVGLSAEGHKDNRRGAAMYADGRRQSQPLLQGKEPSSAGLSARSDGRPTMSASSIWRPSSG